MQLGDKEILLNSKNGIVKTDYTSMWPISKDLISVTNNEGKMGCIDKKVLINLSKLISK